MIVQSDLNNVCELIQDDLMCCIDNLDLRWMLEDRVKDNVCQIIVDRFKLLEQKLTVEKGG